MHAPYGAEVRNFHLVDGSNRSNKESQQANNLLAFIVMIVVNVQLNLVPFERAKTALNSGIATPEFAVMLKQWRAIYLSFVQLRAIGASRGNGLWKPLAPSTIRRRRKPASHNRRKSKAVKQARKSSRRVSTKSLRRVKASQVSSTISRAKQGAGFNGKSPTDEATGRSVSILRDTGTLLNVLNPTLDSSPGRLTTYRRMSVTVGYGGSTSHPSGRATIAGIAEAHQLGNPRRNLPKREIIVTPDLQTMFRMQHVAQLAVNHILNRTEGLQ